MRNLLALLLAFGLMVISGNFVYAQDGESQEQATDTTASTEQAPAEEPQPEAEATPVASGDEDEGEAPGGFQVLKKYFIDGDWRFMSFVLVCMILGLAFCIERIITLNIATTNTDKLLSRIDDQLKTGDVQGAMEVCKSTPGPTASVLYEGLRSASQGPEAVEKAIVSYGSVQMGLLEKGLVWIALFIAIAPMLGFMGTVIGMIQAFDRIQAVGDLSPSVVAGGIKVALLTTVFGLVVAIILQIFYNYIVSKIDGIVNKMEDASIALVDIMAANNIFKK
ncbi:MAG TPA: MotA/TolQ/ExbB proton channel family protein [Saprospiraceae bacterium]|nr:MotA/TolQ/ExbB proton channel family protein [Saprospiraceae bacterium]HMQ85404.1 MotA/TolQ/ExbB proton channel family protein [Saprospiraceae bacterium]